MTVLPVGRLEYTRDPLREVETGIRRRGSFSGLSSPLYVCKCGTLEKTHARGGP